MKPLEKINGVVLSILDKIGEWLFGGLLAEFFYKWRGLIVLMTLLLLAVMCAVTALSGPH